MKSLKQNIMTMNKNYKPTNLIKTEYFKNVTEKDLNAREGENLMILFDSKNLIFAHQKANKTGMIYPSLEIFHPTKKYRMIFSDYSLTGCERELLRTDKSSTQFQFNRICTLIQLNEAIGLYIGMITVKIALK